MVAQHKSRSLYDASTVGPGSNSSVLVLTTGGPWKQGRKLKEKLRNFVGPRGCSDDMEKKLLGFFGFVTIMVRVAGV
ncbi:hypothetical protein ACFX13_002490 [Malus domestica]